MAATDSGADQGTRRAGERSGSDEKAAQQATGTEQETKDDNTEQKAKRRGGEKRKRIGFGWLKRHLRLIIVIAVVATGAALLRVYVVQPYYIPSESMEPTLHGCANCNDDRIVVNKLSGTPQGQDIVVFKRPAGVDAPDNVLIKRVIGVPGDVVSLRNGLVFINNLQIYEPYLNKNCGARSTRPLNGRSSWRVPANDIFVMGDNRCESDDSRMFGPIPIKSVVGKAFAIIWPINRVRIL